MQAHGWHGTRVANAVDRLGRDRDAVARAERDLDGPAQREPLLRDLPG
jgi:hypothetical protein